MKNVFILLFAFLANTTLKAYDAMIDGICYNFLGNEAEVTYQIDMMGHYFSFYSGDVIIPESVTYDGKSYIVTSISNHAFVDCSVTSVTIPVNVLSIGTNAFKGCNRLTTVKVRNNTPVEISENTFTNQSNATLIVPGGSKSAYSEAEYWKEFKEIKESETINGLCYFLDTDNLTAEVIPSDVTAYSGDIVIPSSISCGDKEYRVTSLGNKAFNGCKDLTAITIPSSIATIGEDVFSDCGSLNSIKVDEGNTIYDSRNVCNAIIETATNTLILGCKNSFIPEGITSIGKKAFYSCSGLTSISFPESVTRIDYEAFWGCDGLSVITITKNVNEIGSCAFAKCNGLTSIIVETGNAIYDSRDNCNAIIETATNTLISGCKETLIPMSVTAIGNFAFMYCAGLYSVKLHDNLKNIGNYAFAYSSLTSITIPNSVTNIGNMAFLNCETLTTITIGSGVKTIGNMAFYGNHLSYVKIYIQTPLEIDDNTFSRYVYDYATLYVPFGSASAYMETNCWNKFSKIEELCPEIDGIYYRLDKNNLIADVMPKPDNSTYDGDIIIPSSIIYEDLTYNVTGIGDKAFYFCKELSSISIPRSISNIGQEAFSGCTNLSSIKVDEQNKIYDSRNDCNAVIETGTNTLIIGCMNTIIPENVINIGNNAFYGSIGLTSVTIPQNVKYIGSYAFAFCFGLTSITIPKNVTSIDDMAFAGCSGLKSVVLHQGLTNIGYYAFYKCDNLTTVSIPKSVTSIGNSVFSGCDSLTSISVEEGNTIYDSRNDCNAIIETATNTLISGCKETIIPETITSIGNSAFSHCSGLTSLFIPEGVTSIGSSAYDSCSDLVSITIPESMTSIGMWAFYDCDKLTSVKMLRNNPFEIYNSTFSSNTYSKATLYVPKSCKSLYSEADNWKEFQKIEEYAPEIKVGDIYYSINKDSLIAEVIPKVDYTKYAGDIIIPSSIIYGNITYNVTSIADKTFYGCKDLTAITIPSSITTIGEDVFMFCCSLNSIKVDEGNTIYDSRNNCNAIIETATNSLLAGCKNTIIPENLMSIGDCAFAGCKDLTSITIPNSVSSIGDLAFYGCTGLLAIDIPQSMISIGWASFYQCSSLNSISIPNGIEEIGDLSFYGCCSLTSINIPNSVTSIGMASFYDCSSLTSISVPENITDIKEYAFSFCSNLTSINIPEGITSIKEWSFQGCSALTEVIIPNNVTNIDQGAFCCCSSLASITFPENTEFIGDCAYAGCNSLREIYCYADETPEVYSTTFTKIKNASLIFDLTTYSYYINISSYTPEEIDESEIYLYVPAHSITKYKNHPVWGLFNIKEKGTDIQHLSSHMNAVETPIYNMSGQHISTPQKGLNIINGRKVFVK